jgi:hypothetical protein
MRCTRFGTQQLTEEQRKEAKEIIIEARKRFGDSKKAAKELGIPIGTLSTVASGSAYAGMTTYIRLKKYIARNYEIHPSLGDNQKSG